MKKYFLLIMLAIFAVSCSKKVEVKGTVKGGSPLERVEIIEASGVGTLPLINIGVDSKGEFSGSFDAPQNGLYVITYAGKSNMVYLKGGQTLNISGNAADFPQVMTITGDAKANNDFLVEGQKAFETYATKINMDTLLAKKEPEFLKEFEKINGEVKKIFDDSAAKFKADKEVATYKKDEVAARLVGLLDAYQENHAQLTNNPSYKVSENFTKVKTTMEKKKDEMIKKFPAYREYLLNRLQGDFQKYMSTQPEPKGQPLVSELFAKFFETRKDLSATAKNYFLSYILAQGDLNFMNYQNYDKITKVIDEHITDSKIKKDLKALQIVLMGQKTGSNLDLKITSKDGKTQTLSDLKGKPTLVAFYASWNPNIAVMTVPVLKETTDVYKEKMNYAYVNLDDTKEQFEKTSASLLKGFTGNHYWVDGGINSSDAKNFGMYGFKIPSYILIDKDGKMASRPFFNLQDPEFKVEMEKLTGIKAPAVQLEAMPQIEVTPEMLAPADSVEVK